MNCKLDFFIKGIEYIYPENHISNQDLEEKFPNWNINQLESRTGVKRRFIAPDNETSLDLGYRACNKLFDQYQDCKPKIDALIFCTQTPDYVIPSNACLLQDKLQLPSNIIAFDINLACSGFIYSLGVAKGLLAAGMAKNLLIINAETYSKVYSQYDRATSSLFGDAAAVTWISTENNNSIARIGNFEFATDGKGAEKFIVPAGGFRKPKSDETNQVSKDKNGNLRSLEQIHMDGLGILTFAKREVPAQIKKVCQESKLELEEINLFICHQASKLALDAIRKQLKIESSRFFTDLEEGGNTVSASIPIALKKALILNKIAPKNKLVISGFGAGLSWGSALLFT